MMLKSISLIWVFFIGLVLPGYTQSHDEDLILSIEFGNFEQFRTEVRKYRDLDFILSNGYTPLTFATIKKRPELVRFLLRQRIDIEKPVKGFTPLMYGAHYDLEVLRMLISRGADLNRSLNGRTAATIAISTGNWAAADILRESGAIIEPIDGPDGPYIFNLSADTTVIVSVTPSNQLVLDTINNHIHEIYIRTPANDSFMFPLRDPDYELESVFEEAERIFVLSDIEGNFADFTTILRNNKIVDNRLNWTFGNGHLVLLGDFVDRGMYVTQVLWLIYKLEQEATSSGGKVHFILGNHELMNIQGDVRYAQDKYHILSYLIGKEVREFYGNESFLGRWVRSKNVIEKVGGYIFVHGGISDSLFRAELSIPRINEVVRNYLARPDSVTDLDAPLVLNDYGVLWYRGLITDYIHYEKTSDDSLEEILSFYEASNIVVGHCIVDDISADYDGKVIRVDVDHYNNQSSGIYIEGDSIYKATKSGELELVTVQTE